ncbi:MAG: septum site-determining protein MinC [Sulfobacillus acidophilus]|uniref:Septum site-determining protein MinC n=1 Tax=Sulfobacillus acidophilus TaxID=53633 RepID=A0A2T2WIK4_9FIRM|nr:MAG: septum site-determining protein MinC [Sulfobacillus acidophilus]
MGKSTKGPSEVSPAREKSESSNRVAARKAAGQATSLTAQRAAERVSEWRYEEDARRDPTLLVRRTLRSGQRVRYFGNVVVLGDVNPGAEITAGGDIIVMGWLRGVAHAGAGGNDRAMVSAFRLNPTQLRIGQYIGRAPDQGEAVLPDIPEFAEVRDGHLVIDRWRKSVLTDPSEETHA